MNKPRMETETDQSPYHVFDSIVLARAFAEESYSTPFPSDTERLDQALESLTKEQRIAAALELFPMAARNRYHSVWKKRAKEFRKRKLERDQPLLTFAGSWATCDELTKPMINPVVESEDDDTDSDDDSPAGNVVDSISKMRYECTLEELEAKVAQREEGIRFDMKAVREEKAFIAKAKKAGCPYGILIREWLAKEFAKKGKLPKL